MGDPRTNSQSLGVIIVAAGSSTRMGGGDKQFADLNGEPVLGHSLRVFAWCRHVAGIALVLSWDNLDRGRRLVADAGLDDLVICVQGGERRQDSARIGLGALKSSVAETEFIAVHDGARPFVDDSMIERGLATARVTGAAAAGVAVKDTIKGLWIEPRGDENARPARFVGYTDAPVLPPRVCCRPRTKQSPPKSQTTRRWSSSAAVW